MAPGFTSEQAVVADMMGIADRLRAVIIADGPSTQDADAIAYRQNFGSGRVYVVDPKAKVFDTVSAKESVEPMSARVAGLIARSDNDRGFWWSPSNLEIYGITGTERPIDFTSGIPMPAPITSTKMTWLLSSEKMAFAFGVTAPARVTPSGRSCRSGAPQT
ncbi:phage tail sheath subtilisin-like domain-containing protein [Veronia nyctiphanis]|uniref:phage tail sheath subtilisin-like domain-containing protein n=1 Tax=Veronia nyctiphanis TaxID=1278244 RepID=UPI001F1A55FA|nr:phage tail sheath subtilisin-like domain-containing protein [Veronia nyctiphanis]